MGMTHVVFQKSCYLLRFDDRQKITDEESGH